MEPIRVTSESLTGLKKWSQFWWKSAKAMPKEKS